MSLKQICIHWTGGSYGSRELAHYHFTVGPSGAVNEGHKPPESNIPKNGVSLSPQPLSTYVPHCGGGNSYTIGVAVMGMHGYRNPENVGKYPLTRAQCEALFKLVAGQCLKYGIAVEPETVFTHYEFGLANPDTSSRGKIDIVHLPPWPELGAGEIGNFIRGKVKWYMAEIEKKKAKATNGVN